MTDARTVRPSPADRFFARRAKLPRPGAWRQETVRIPARDGVELAADLYTPLSASKGVLLTRGPYGRGGMIALSAARLYAAQGYTVLFASTRGTAGSGGVLDPMRDEQRDGHDLVAWLRGQPWYPGRFGCVGGSYLGHTQWALLTEPPDDLAVCVIAMGPHDFSRHAWGTGTFNLDLLGWAELLRATQQSLLRALLRQGAAARRLASIYRAAPLAAAADRHFAATAPWLHERLVRPDLDDPYWAPMQHSAALDKAAIPILIQAGWQDIFLRQSMEQYARLHERGTDVGLTVGAWTHLDLGFGGLGVTAPESLSWLDHHLAGKAGEPRAAAVRVQLTHSRQWRDLGEWPPPATATTLYLHGDGRLAAEAAPATDAARAFVFDPGNPTPAVGGNLIKGGGYKDDTALARRQDVLAYETSPLTADLIMMGSAHLTLGHAMERQDGDLFARISDVDGAGRSRNVAETYARVQSASASTSASASASTPTPASASASAGAGPGTAVSLELLPAAHTFPAGHRIRLLLAGGSFPQFARSAGSGENPLTAAVLSPNRHTIEHAGGVSALRLPVIT
jgi:putative CocE/NonD family hydrolase